MTEEKESLRFVSFTESVMLRGKMYTPTGTFGEIFSFLQGCFVGSHPRHPLMSQRDIEQWPKFLEWLRETYHTEPHKVILELEEKREENPKLLFSMYRQFIDQSDPTRTEQERE